MAGEHPRDTALAEPSGAGAGAKARCPQTGDCVANVSARPCATGLGDIYASVPQFGAFPALLRLRLNK